MSRYLVCGVALLLLAAPVRAQDPPEKLLSPTTQLFVKWDGLAAHKQAYQASIWGPVMAGPTGDTIRLLLARGPKYLGGDLLANPLLDGKPPEDLKAIHADLKHAEKALDLIADKGIVLAAEVREPRPTIGGFGKLVGGLLGGNDKPGGGGAELFVPEAQVLVIVPDVGDQAEVLFGSLRLLVRQDNVQLTPLPPALGRKGFILPDRGGGPPVRVAWWVEGRHFVLYAGTAPVENIVAGMKANAAKGGVTGHALFQRCLKTGQFESVARGFVDAESVVGLAKRLAGPFVPGLNERVDAIGLGNLKAVVFSSGFQGKESRALYEFDLPGERKGMARMLKPQPVTLNDLPPLPPDVSRFSMLRIDPAATYDGGLALVETLAVGENFGVEDQAKTPAESIGLRKEYLAREVDKVLGVNIKEEFLPYLGDKLVIYQTPTEGLSVFGTVVCVSLKEPAKAKVAADRIARSLESFAGGPMKIRKKVYHGVEVREIYSNGFGVLTPTYAVVNDWLVIAGHPQPVQGMILRAKGNLQRWKPDPETAARLSQMPSDAVGIQYCHPKSTVQNLCCIGPLVISTFSRFNFGNTETEFNPIDIGMIPNGHELSSHLFPNLTYTRDDGRTIRIETNESFSLPLEFMGFDALAFGILTGLVGL
jgi:hypothetical protein